MLATRAKNKLSEIEKPRGFERNLPLDQIVGAATDAKHNYQLYFLVQWQGCDELDLLPANEVNEHCPQEVIAYYEARSQVVAKCERRKRILEQAERDLIAYPPTDAPETNGQEQEAEDAAEVAEVEGEQLAEQATAVESEAVAPVVAVEDTDRAEELDTAGTADNSMSASAVSETHEGPAGTEQLNESADSSRMDAEQTAEPHETAATGDEEPDRGVETPTMDEDDTQNDSFLAEVASEVAQHQARTEALPDDIEMPNVGF